MVANFLKKKLFVFQSHTKQNQENSAVLIGMAFQNSGPLSHRLCQKYNLG